MAQTMIHSDGLAAACVIRPALNTTIVGSAVVTKAVAGSGVSLVSTGVDAGTGDVTVTILNP